MSRRQSMPNGYPNRPGTRMLPPSYQPEPVPMRVDPTQSYQSFPMNHSNSFKTNRVGPPHQSLEYPSSMISNNSRVPTSYRQPTMNSNYPIQSYYPQNNHMGILPEDGFGENAKPKSWCAQPLCLGLTRLSGGILFGTMIFLALGSIGGLIASVLLYLEDDTTDPQWKILGMVVCSIMLLTVLVTLCIFMYCYKKGRIVNNNNNNNLLTPPYHQENDVRHPFDYNRSPMPYGRMENFSTTPIDDGIIQVRDKLTNTETTISPLRPRDIHRGVWNGKNAYGGISHRPIEPPKMTHRAVQALQNEIDRIPSKPRNQVMDIVPQTIIRLPGKRREHPRHFIEPQASEESLETIELPKKGKHKPRFNKVTVKHVKATEEPDFVDEDFNTDHFYQ